tara:strand:+ start:904 stop:1101 length:198 start_codon:yes stop_codon:yes gene_type:complete
MIKPSAFGVGYSIYTLSVDAEGKRHERYLTDATTLNEAKQLCPDAVDLVCPSEPQGHYVVLMQSA